MGFGHSYALGLKEGLKTDASVIVTSESDYSFNTYDIPKMLPYLDNCDIAIGTRQNQVLVEKGNQNSLLHVLGNFFLAKLIQIKYFSLLHAGVVNLTDVGCNFRFYPPMMKIKKCIEENRIGRIISVQVENGSYLPDWHPWEEIQDFYVSKRETGGCREIVPFELTWLNDIFGEPEALSCLKDKLSKIDVDIDDIYYCLLRYPNGMIANITVEVISRPKATRELRILGTKGEIVFSGDENCVRYISEGDEDWNVTSLTVGTVEAGYINPEEPYISEMAAFVAAVENKDPERYPNSLGDDARVLKLLYKLEQLSEK